MRSKRLLGLAAGSLAPVLLLLLFLHFRHKGDVSTAAARPPTVSVATARIGYIANQLCGDGVPANQRGRSISRPEESAHAPAARGDALQARIKFHR